MKKQKKNSSIRIISGQYRGRNIPILEQEGLRPSPIRIRETLFNWLQFEIEGSSVLDAFSGSGAMGLEALSRGAKSALFIDKSAAAIEALRQILTDWKIPHARCLINDALKLNSTSAQYDYLFLDPPFSLNIHQAAIDHFVNSKFLKKSAKVYIEAPFRLNELNLPDGYVFIKTAKAGKIHFGLVQYDDNGES